MQHTKHTAAEKFVRARKGMPCCGFKGKREGYYKVMGRGSWGKLGGYKEKFEEREGKI